MASRRRIIIKICLFLHILEVLLGSVLSVLSFLLQTAADVGLAEAPSWLGIPCALFGLVGISIIVLNKLKEELVFVLVFHGLTIGLCVISLILAIPKVGRWQPVSGYQASGICKQIEQRCNCTRSLPTIVFECTDLTGIYDLNLVISVIIGLCLANTVLATYFDFIIIQKYAPTENALHSSTIGGRSPYDEAQLVDSFGEICNIGPQNTPELEPRSSDDSVGYSFLNRRNRNEKEQKDQRKHSLMADFGSSYYYDGYENEMEFDNRLLNIEEDEISEQGIEVQETEIAGKDKTMGTSSSLPADKATVEVKDVKNTKQAKVPSVPNSANGSKQSIRSRKDALIQRLHAVHPTNLEGEEDGNNALLQELERSSRTSFNNNMNGPANSIRTSPRIIQTDETNIDKGEEISKLFPKELLNSTAIKNSVERVSAERQENRIDLPKRSYSVTHVVKNSSSDKGTLGTSKRSQSEGNVLNIQHLTGKVSNLDVQGMEPGQTDKMLADHFSALNTNHSENNLQQDNENMDQHVSIPPSRRTGVANSSLQGLPPLPLKDCQFDLSVQERTFSAPTLPFFDSNDKERGRDQSTRRPGSSGSQILAERKKEFIGNVRNDLIDKCALSNERQFGLSGQKFGMDNMSDIENRRRNSFDTTSTDIEIEDKVEGFDGYDDLGKKPRWHPPWQLKQEIIAHKDSVPVLAIEPRNRWFASGSNDRSMKIWGINNGHCKLTVKVHKSGIRALAFGSTGHRFIFSAADDRQLICTDIEVNKIVAHYPDQSSVIYAMGMYHQAELLVTCGRDKYVKIWDTREKKCIKTMRGHMNTASSLAIIQNSGQIISGSHDSTMRIWDIGEGRCTQILTGHEKSVRSIYVHTEEPVISSASTERIIHWSMPDGEKIKEITPTDISINCISVNPQGALVAAGSNGVIHLWDWKSGHKFQKIHRTRVYESQEVPICVFSTAFDQSGSRLFVSDASNIIKVYGEAYTRVRRRHANTDDKNMRKDKQLNFPTPDNAFI